MGATQYSMILTYDPQHGEVNLLSSRRAGEALPPRRIPVAMHMHGNITRFPKDALTVAADRNRFPDDDQQMLVDYETTLGNGTASMLFEGRDVEVCELAENDRFLEPLMPWNRGSAVKRGFTTTVAAILSKMTAGGSQKVLLSWKGEVRPLGPAN